MFFVLSKTAAFLALPSNIVLIISVAGLTLLLTRYRTLGGRLLTASVVLLLLFGITPLGILLTTSLEQRFPAYDMSGPAPDGIIVLGGGIDPDATAALGEPVIGAAFQRLITARRLAEAYPAARVVYSAGNGNLPPRAGREADVARAMLIQLGVSAERVTLERESRNTVENAVFTQALIHAKPGERWLLVTSPAHMPRAMGCFRRAGVPVIAVPAGPREPWLSRWPLRSLGAELARLDDAAHEWLGLIAYRLTGRMDALFPAP
jgi:uncharacterized SAM-binding protein YcdF (DUF218 family)